MKTPQFSLDWQEGLILFAISSNHFMQRPLRDSMAALCGAENLNWLMTATLLGTLGLSFLLQRIEMKQNFSKAIPYLLLSIGVVQVVFYQKLESPTFGWAFFYFSFTSTTSLTLLSLVWRKLSLTVNRAQDFVIQIYPTINLGAVAGPLITLVFSNTVGSLTILPLSSLFLVSIAFALVSHNYEDNTFVRAESIVTPRFPFKRMFFFIMLYTFTSTGFYFFMIKTVSTNLVEHDHVLLFTVIDLATNSTVVLIPFLIRSLITKPIAFLLVPCLSLVLMTLLGIHITLITATMALIVFKVSNLSVQRPAREVLMVASSLTLPYSTKNFLDTFAYRLGDTLSSWGIFFMLSSGIELRHIALLLIPFIIVWIITGHSISKNVNLITPA